MMHILPYYSFWSPFGLTHLVAILSLSLSLSLLYLCIVPFICMPCGSGTSRWWQWWNTTIEWIAAQHVLGSPQLAIVLCGRIDVYMTPVFVKMASPPRLHRRLHSIVCDSTGSRLCSDYAIASDPVDIALFCLGCCRNFAFHPKASAAKSRAGCGRADALVSGACYCRFCRRSCCARCIGGAVGIPAHRIADSCTQKA